MEILHLHLHAEVEFEFDKHHVLKLGNCLETALVSLLYAVSLIFVQTTCTINVTNIVRHDAFKHAETKRLNAKY